MTTLMKCFKKPILLFTAILALVACNSKSPEAVGVDSFAFMSGNWLLAQEGRQYSESWTATGNRMEGSAYEVALGDTVFAEAMEIFKRDADGWVMAVRMAGEHSGNTVFFTLTTHRDGHVMFENATHDFPKRIGYTLATPGAMQAIVDGGADSEQKLEFSFVKTE